MSVVRSTVERIKNLIPEKVKSSVKRSSLYLRDRAEADNVFHCCTHKSASQWVRSLLSDRITFRYTGLEAFHYQTEWMGGVDPRPYHERRFAKRFPSQTVAVALYTDYSGFQSIPKPRKYRAFFVVRDPRDVTVSWYFSVKNSHPTGKGEIEKHRKRLRKLSKSEGIRYCIEYLDSYGLYDAQRSWIKAKKDPREKVFKYENLTGNEQFENIKSLFSHCTFSLPNPIISELIDKNSFTRKSGGRKKGEENQESHQRKGVSGDWKNHFNEEVKDIFIEKTDGLAQDLGYEK